MAYCHKCGKEIDDDAVVCVHCGCAVPSAANSGAASDDASSAAFAVLSFFFPLVGLILFLVWKDTYPKRAKSAGKGALIGVIVNVVFSVIVGVFSFILAMLAAGAA